jgi:hypothetical protein
LDRRKFGGLKMNPTLNGYRIAGSEQEWEVHEASHHGFVAGEWEAETGYSSQRQLQSLQKTARATVPIAKQLAPIAAKTIVGLIPNSINRHMLNSVVREGEAIATTMEAEFFGSNEFEAEVGQQQLAHDAALAEVLAAEASHSNSEHEAEAFLGAVVPEIIASMGGRSALRSVIPTLVKANAQLVRLLHRKGAAGQRLMRLVPTILRRTVASLSAVHRAGRKVTASIALPIMANHVAQVLGDAQVVSSGIIRNAILQQKTTR